MEILSARALEGLKQYTYKPGGYTWLDRLHNPMWNWMVTKLPMWLAPNLITLAGLVLMIIAYAVLWQMTPDFTGEAPSWAYYFAGISIVVYTNLDNLDGKQARRTGTSSPLGQLFDHGCDALALHVMLSLVQTSLNEPSCTFTSIAATSVYLPWLISHWEEYHTGILMYGDGWFGILEANYVLAIITFISGTFGVGVYETPMQSLVPWWPWPMSVKHAFIIFAMGISLVQFYGQMYRVFSREWQSLPELERGNKELGTQPRLKHLAYVGLLILVGIVYLADDRLQPYQARVSALLYGLVYATVATQLIMDHMCKEPFQPPLVPLGVLIAAMVNSLAQAVDGRALAFALAGFMLVYYSIYATTVISQVTTYLGIRCLTITPKRA
ncbi:hypothetical protein HYH03_016150 [Edaphochlamys debaryana]|uniref:Ethanolaminephosphotransferase n=1 Tax=Edaphochlamys debaryana TaxID=47281 RepID=A0A836BQI2_9CHLO|nr:hypothetical protein HYH03_016150 [Edaphochlamys debaryana]|eukprot:KAG2485052.1 hypothetical protein HYH03_016150 [Edaphochlamys debaryana]